MKEQLWGIAISLMVHGIAAILFAGVGQGISAAVRTVTLDFSIQSGGRWGEDGSKSDGETGIDSRSGVDKARVDDATAPPAHFSQRREVESSQRPDTALQTEAHQPPSLASGKPFPPAEPEPQSIQAIPPAKANPVASRAVSPPLPEETPSAAEPSAPVRRIHREKRTRTLHQPPPQKQDRAEHSPMEDRPATDPENPARAELTANHDPVPSGGEEQLIESHTEGNGKVAGGSPERVGPGSGGGPVDPAGADGDVSSKDGANAYLKAHFNAIRRHLMKHLCFPPIARERGWSGKVVVSFTVYPDGRADGIAVHRSCGIPILDKSALKTVESACPFPSPPSAARITIPILYDLN